MRNHHEAIRGSAYQDFPTPLLDLPHQGGTIDRSHHVSVKGFPLSSGRPALNLSVPEPFGHQTRPYLKGFDRMTY